MRILYIALKHASITPDWLKISGVRSWGLSGRGAVWGQDRKKNIDFDSLPENPFQNLFFSVSRRFKRVDGKQFQRKARTNFSEGLQGKARCTPLQRFFKGLSKCSRTRLEGLSYSSRMIIEDNLKVILRLGWDYLGGSCKAGSFKAGVI